MDKSLEALNTTSETTLVLSSQEVHDKQYAEMVGSLQRFIPHEEQERFRKSHILVAGCGSIGNPIAEMAVMMGAENVTVADPDKVERVNLTRQRYQEWQIGMNKAHATALNLRLINPVPPVKDEITVSNPQSVLPELGDNAPVSEITFRVARNGDTNGIRSLKEGITPENVERLVKDADVVIDAVDIRALDMVYELHRQASLQRKPVIVGYDMAGTSMLAIYRYDLKEMKPLNGDLTEDQIQTYYQVKSAYQEGRITEADFMNYVYDAFNGPINPLKVPVEQLEELITREGGERTPQMGTTSTVLSSLAVEATRRILNGEDVKDIVLVDNPSVVRKRNPSLLRKAFLLMKALSKVTAQGKEVRETLDKLKNQANG